MLINCPHCNTALDIAPEHFGQSLICPACKGKLQVDAPASGSEQAEQDDGKPQREGWPEQDHANPNFAISFMIGLAVTAAILAAMLPVRDTRIGGIFLDRGWVNYAETFLFCWGITILMMKLRMNTRQERATVLNLFPRNLGREINRHTVSGFIENIYKIPVILRDSLIVNRIRKALELFESRPNNGEVATFLNTQSELDANRSAGSYALIKVFLWAIPILGFIGTVIGLSTAVGSLSMGDNADPEALKDSINSLTSGLGLAFDTTLLGLILSILMSFPMAAVQKREEETLTIIDAFCNEKVLPKLNDSKYANADDLIEQAESMPELVASLAHAHETFLKNLNENTIQLRMNSEKMRSALDEHQESTQQSMDNAIRKLSDATSSIYKSSDSELTRSLKAFTEGIERLNLTLTKLDAKTVMVGSKEDSSKDKDKSDSKDKNQRKGLFRKKSK